MTVQTKAKGKIIVVDGNEAAAKGVALARPDVVAVYPITPQSSLVEALSAMIATGELDAELMNVEGEHSVLSALQGAALAGARTYTATSGPGLAFMFEPYIRQPGLRLPMVASLVTRDTLTPQCVWGGHQDAMLVRECGWIHMYCETVQEILDTVIMGYKVAEHPEIMLPVNVNHDGNYLSFGVTSCELPDQAMVDDFLGPKSINWHAALDPERPMSVDPLTGNAGGAGPSMFVRYRKGQTDAMARSLQVICDVHADWAKRTGRAHAPLVEEYRLDDAEIALVTLGSMTGAAKDCCDALRDAGKRVGIIKVKTYRPFPVQAMARALSKVKAVGVVDRSVSYGWNSGPMHHDVLAAMAKSGFVKPCVSFIGGLAGADMTQSHFERAFDIVAKGDVPPGPIWMNEKD
ncbi:NADH-dependent phenylglyoxylate dehydrogenase subunit alpha [Rhodospirillaceae bacterium LM-1]|nr:NADH-dependent phenylglyoxylate dehydrogenase subunit alpha [Rhodospirillaceae bacterium LM-1]